MINYTRKSWGDYLSDKGFQGNSCPVCNVEYWNRTELEETYLCDYLTPGNDLVDVVVHCGCYSEWRQMRRDLMDAYHMEMYSAQESKTPASEG